MWLLGTKLGFSGKAASTVDHWAVSLGPQLEISKAAFISILTSFVLINVCFLLPHYKNASMRINLCFKKVPLASSGTIFKEFKTSNTKLMSPQDRCGQVMRWGWGVGGTGPARWNGAHGEPLGTRLLVCVSYVYVCYVVCVLYVYVCVMWCVLHGVWESVRCVWCVCVVCMCGVYVCGICVVWCLLRSDRGFGFPEGGVMDRYAESQAQVLWKSRSALTHWTVSPGPSVVRF